MKIYEIRTWKEQCSTNGYGTHQRDILNKTKSQTNTKKKKKKTITGQQEQNIEHISLFRGRLDMFYTVQL